MSTKRPARAGRKPAAKSKMPARTPAPRTKRAADPIDLPVPKRRQATYYDPSFCERVIELGERGKSKWQIAVALGCSRKSLYQWMRTHEEFAEAMEESQFRAMAHWEDIGQAGLTMKGFNANLYSYLMKSRFREQYSDKVNVAHRGAVEVDEVEMTDLDLARRIAFIFGNALKRKQELHENGQEQVVVDGPWPPLVHKQ